MFFTFLTVVSTVAIIASVAYKYLEVKSKAPVDNDDVIQLKQELNAVKKRLENVEAILIAEDTSNEMLDDVATDATEATSAAKRSRSKN